MDEGEAAAVRFFVFCALGILWYAWPYRRLRVAVYREDLFSIRDELWDYMNKRKSFDDPAYRAMRQLLNGLIRLAPRLYNGGLVLALLRKKTHSHEGAPSVLIRLVEDPELKEYLLRVESAARHRTFEFLCLEGLSALICRPVFWFAGLRETRRSRPAHGLEAVAAVPSVRQAVARSLERDAFVVGEASASQARRLLGAV